MMLFRYRGVEFGGNTGPLIVTGFDPGPVDVRMQDTEAPQRDGVIPGRDLLGAATWGIDLSTNEDDIVGALTANASLEAAWKDPAVRLRPTVKEPLSYEIGGRWRRVYGRPGTYVGLNGDVRSMQGGGSINADFRVLDPIHYDDAEQMVRLDIIPATAGGFRAPFVFPLSSLATPAARAGFVTNQGDAPTPLKAVFHGPISNPWVRAAAGWEIGLTGSIAYDMAVTVDPLAGTVTRSDGAPVAGMLTYATRLSESKLPAGQSELTFGGTDQTGTAYVELRWRHAHVSL